jgi:hypothetical protein
MLGITRLLLGVALGAALATPALAIEATAFLQCKEKLKIKECGNAKAEGLLELEMFPDRMWQDGNYRGAYADLGEGNFAFSYDAVSYDELFRRFTAAASELCGFPVRILAATQSSFTARLAKDKAKAIIKSTFDGVAFDDAPMTATLALKCKGSYIEVPEETEP